MDDQRLAAALRSLRIRRRWRQSDLAVRVGISRATISRLEHGHVDAVSIRTLRALARALEARLDLDLRWRGTDLDRLLNAQHSALHEAFARTLGNADGWTFSPEVSFSIYGERGIIDVLGWHASSRSLLVIELKTQIVDVQEHLGTLDRKVRLAAKIGRERGWQAANVGAWLVVAGGRTNRRRIEAHRAVLRSALPHDGRRGVAWLRAPVGPLRAMSQMPYVQGVSVRRDMATRDRVRPRRDDRHGHPEDDRGRSASVGGEAVAPIRAGEGRRAAAPGG